MHSYRLESFGSLQGLKLIEEQQPVPGRNQVLTVIRACSLNYRVIQPFAGGTGTLTQSRRRADPLFDGAGEVVAMVWDLVGLFKRGIGLWEPFFPHWFAEHGCRRRERNWWHSGQMDG